MTKAELIDNLRDLKDDDEISLVLKQDAEDGDIVGILDTGYIRGGFVLYIGQGE